jgi:hypothetical protein
MPYTSLNRYEQITPGTQIDLWGETQNRTLTRIDQSTKGVIAFSVNGDRNLVYSNDASDESHFAVINVAGGIGGRVLMQPVQATYVVRNGATGNVVFTVDGESIATIQPNCISVIINTGDGKVYQEGFGGDPKAYIDDGLAAERAYAESLVFDTVAGELPGQSGNAGKFLQTNGTNGSWQQPTIADVATLEDTLSDLADQSFAFALIF